MCAAMGHFDHSVWSSVGILHSANWAADVHEWNTTFWYTTGMSEHLNLTEYSGYVFAIFCLFDYLILKLYYELTSFKLSMK